MCTITTVHLPIILLLFVFLSYINTNKLQKKTLIWWRISSLVQLPSPDVPRGTIKSYLLLCDRRRIRVYIEYQSVCPYVGIGSPPWPKGGGHPGIHTHLRGRGWGTQFGRRTKSLELCILWGYYYLSKGELIYVRQNRKSFPRCLSVRRNTFSVDIRRILPVLFKPPLKTCWVDAKKRWDCREPTGIWFPLRLSQRRNHFGTLWVFGESIKLCLKGCTSWSGFLFSFVTLGRSKTSVPLRLKLLRLN